MSKRTIVAAGLVLALVAARHRAASRQKQLRPSRRETLRERHGHHAPQDESRRVLATKSGMTLDMYKPDGKNKSNCYTGCAGFGRR